MLVYPHWLEPGLDSAIACSMVGSRLSSWLARCGLAASFAVCDAAASACHGAQGLPWPLAASCLYWVAVVGAAWLARSGRLPVIALPALLCLDNLWGTSVENAALAGVASGICALSALVAIWLAKGHGATAGRARRRFVARERSAAAT